MSDEDEASDPYRGAGASNNTRSSMFPCQGVDVSRWQGEYDWDDATTNGHIRFGYARATSGDHAEDEQFARNWAALAKLDILRGAYHFASPPAAGRRVVDDAQQEANHFCDVVTRAETAAHDGPPMYDGKVMPPVLDYEKKLSLSSADQRTWINTWITTTQQRLHRGVILYSGPHVWLSDFRDDPWLTQLPLWIARYEDATVPRITPWTHWVLWQWSGGGRGNIFRQLVGHDFPGVPRGGAVDIDAFWGSPEQLRMLGDPRRDRWLLDDDGNVGANPFATARSASSPT